jgi:tetratricopeptide (TPR) repeat protein
MMCDVASAQGSPDAVIDALHASAEGNPFFIEELCRSLIAGGALDARDGQLLALQPLSSAELPSSIEAVVQCRLDQLSHDALSLVRRACVIGREFSLRELAALGDHEDDLGAPIELLVNVALIEPTQVMPQRRYRFKHVTTQLVAYESLPPKRRREDHRRIGTMLAQADAGVDACLDTIAYHFVCSDDHAMAIDYSLRAGVHAADRAAHSIAARHIRRAVELLEQDGATSQDDERLIGAYVKLGQSMHYLQGLSGLDVMRACERANLASRGANVNDGVFLAVAMLWRHEYQRSNLTEARNLASQLLGMARASPDPGRHLVAYCAHGVVEFLMGDYPKARLYLDIALEHYDEGAELRWIGRFSASLAVVAMTFKGLTLTNLGEFSAGERVCRGACALATELKHPESHCAALFYLGQAYIAHDRLTDAIRTNDELLVIATECQLPYLLELERLNRGICMIRSNAGSPQQAIQMLGQSADAIIALGVTLIAPQYHCAMAEIFAAIGQPAHAHDHLRRADEAVRAMGRCQFEPDVKRVRGVVAALEDIEGALPHFESALAMARDGHSRLKQLRFALGLAPLLRALGREDTVRTVLCEAQHGLQDEAHWPLVARVQQMLAELPSSERRELEAAGHPPAHQA